MAETQKNKRPSLLTLLLKYAVPVVISVGLCWVLYRSIDIRQMWHVISTECDFSLVGGALFIGIGAMVSRALRWQIQLRALGITPPLRALVMSIFGTYAVNLVFPRLGEIWRTGYIANRQRAPFATVFGSMVADRLADTVAVGLISIVTFLLASGQMLEYFTDNPDSYQSALALLRSPWLWLSLAACCFGLWWLVKGRTHATWVLRLRQALRQLWQGFAVILTMPGKGLWLVYTLGIWLCYFTQLWVCFYAFPFTSALVADHGVIVPLVCFVLTSLSMSVPSNGGIGPWQWAMVFGLGIYGLEDKTMAHAFANTVLGCTTLMIIVLGLLTFIYIPIDRRTAPNVEGGLGAEVENHVKDTKAGDKA